jgi:hypothetical protein
MQPWITRKKHELAVIYSRLTIDSRGAITCTTIYQILLDSRKIHHRSRGRLRSIKIFFSVAA